MRIALLLEYLGNDFCGSQAQKNLRTVQSVLEEALTIYFRLSKSTKAKKPLRVILSGRTDSGVHASAQVAHFDVPAEAQTNPLDLELLAWAINGILASDISVRQAVLVSDTFHARFNAIERAYVYRILNRPQRSPLRQNTHYFLRTPLGIGSMEEAIKCLPGRHDFVAFKSSNADKLSTICEVNYARLLNLGEGELEFSIAADHFVYNMIRIIVGTLIEIGLNKRPPDSLKMALMSGKRKLAGPTAPAWGLCLVSVKYPEPDIFNSAKQGKIGGKEIVSEYRYCKTR